MLRTAKRDVGLGEPHPNPLYDRGIGGSIGLQPPTPFPPRSLQKPDGRGESAEIDAPTTDEESYGFGELR